MKSDNRLLLAILAFALTLLLVVCVVGAAFVYHVYSSSGPGQIVAEPGAQTPGATARPAATPAPVQSAPRQHPSQVLYLSGFAPDSLDPAQVRDEVQAEYIVHIFSGLVGIDAELKLVPDLAQKWDLSPDGRTYTFTLRKDAKFQDGRPVTAQDVKYSFERTLDPRTHSPVADAYLGDIAGALDKLGGRAAEVSGVKVVDDATLQITIDAPKSYFLWQLTYPTAFIVDRNNVEKGGAAWADKPNGTGPFKLASKSATEIVLVRNDNYYGDKPNLLEAHFMLRAAISNYETGEIDMVDVGTADVDRVTDPRNALNKELVIADTFSFSYLGLNVTMPPLDDPKVRQAILYAIDKDKLTSVVLKGMAAKADSILPPGIPGFNETAPAPSYDPARAKQLLAESKYAGKAPALTLTVGMAGAQAPPVIQAIQANIAANLGITVDIQLVDGATFQTGLNQRKYAMFFTGWIADYPDPYDFLDILFFGQSGLNHMSYQNPQFDALVQAARVERDDGKRMQLYQQAEKILIDDAPAVPLFYGREYWLVKPYVKGVTRPPLILPWLAQVSAP